VLALLLLALAPAAPEGDGGRMDWWREARFGLFLHWGLYSIPGGEWEGRTDHGEWIRDTARIPLDVYDRFLQRFDPAKLDADRWAAAARDAGMRYVVITTKHHDGFCLFDSKLTDFDVMSTPFRRDVMAELAAACRRHGLRIGWYHSIMDWHHPDYLPRRAWERRPADGASFPRYVEHLRGQVEELLTKYGDVGVMWFDGEWEKTWTRESGRALYDLCRKLQPRVIVNNRVDKGRDGMAGMTRGSEFAGDFGTPEQEIPDRGLPGLDWETCMTLNDYWGWNRRDGAWKPADDLIRKLVDIASKGGNFLLNVGPTPEGEFPAPCVERLQEIGRWMRTNGEAIHGTSAGPFEGLPWGRCTSKRAGPRSRLYLHVFQWPRDGRLHVPGLASEPRRAWLLAAPDRPIAAAREGNGVTLGLGAAVPGPVPVVAVEVEGAPVVYRAPEIVVPSATFVRPMEVRLLARVEADVEIRYTLDGSEPGVGAVRYERPFAVRESTVVRARTFHGGKPVSETTEARLERVTPIAAATPENIESPLRCEVFEGTWERLPDFDGLRARSTEWLPEVALPAGGSSEHVARRYRGFLRAPRDDVYVFALTSDDGSRLRVSGRVVVDHDGLHGSSTKRGSLALAAGLHPIVVEWFNLTGDGVLSLEWGLPGELAPFQPAGR
jgi:alpha-L-fucosidase